MPGKSSKSSKTTSKGKGKTTSTGKKTTTTTATSTAKPKPSAETLKLVENIKNAILKLPIAEESSAKDNQESVEPSNPDIGNVDIDSNSAEEAPKTETEAAESLIIDGLSKAPKEALELLGKEREMITHATKMSNKSLRSTILDVMIDYVDDVDIARAMVKSRYDVWVGSKGCTDQALLDSLEEKKKQVLADYSQYVYDKSQVEQSWTLGGVVHLYNCYKRLPPDHMDSVKLVFTTSSKSGSGGLAWYGSGICMVNYSGNTLDSFRGDTLFNKTSTFYDLNTFTHETGHLVDSAVGPRVVGSSFSDSKEYLDLYKWESLLRWYEFSDDNKMAGLVNKICTNIEEPYGKIESESEKQIVNMVGTAIIRTNTNSSDYHNDAANETLAQIYLGNIGTEENQETLKAALSTRMPKESDIPKANENNTSVTLVADADGVKEKKDPKFMDNLDGATKMAVEKYRDELKNLNFIAHVTKYSRGNNCYSAEPAPHTKDTQIHADYNGAWWAYSYDIRKNAEISNYQFCNPSESFAELYANYFISGNGARTPSQYKNWFEKRVVKEIKPEEKEALAKSSGTEPDPSGSPT